MKFKKFIFIIFLIQFLCCTHYYKPEIKNWKKAQNIYSDPVYNKKNLEIIHIEKIKKNTDIKIENNNYSSNKIYFYNIDYSKLKNYLYIYNNRNYILRLYSPKHKYRPIFAKWINSKLIYIEIYFNPHYGIYFIYDVENELYIVSESENDGLDVYNKYKEKIKKNK